jgi:hypothetical protein
MIGISRTRWNLKAVTGEKRRRSYPTLAEIGLPDFETAQQCERRQNSLRSSLGSSENGMGSAQALASCSAKGCRLPVCIDACHYASRRRRRRYILRAYRLLSSLAGPLYLVTVVHLNWEASIGGLLGTGTRVPREFVKRRLSRLPNPQHVIAVGQFERALNVELDGSMSWSGEVHLVVGGATKEELRAAFNIDAQFRRNPQEKLVKVKEVSGLGRALGYCLKYFLASRVAYVMNNGRQGRRSMPLKREYLAELGTWHASLKSGERFILFGCRRNGRRLKRVSKSLRSRRG